MGTPHGDPGSSHGLMYQDSSHSINNQQEDLDLLEPVAICGFALKFPGDVVSAESFWRVLVEKRSAMTEYPADRLNIDAFHHPTRKNALCTRGGHFIREDLGLFDADFFSITPSEAVAMDPMQRLLLETSFAALESSGIRLEDVRGSRTSVHTGCFSNDYLYQLLRDPERLPQYAAVGVSQSMLANRISWFFGLRGPSMNIDSACSSSAVAVDNACQLLRSGQTDMGLVAGCNLILDPDYSTILSNMHMLSPSGRCHTFDHRADGYSRGEGVGVVILKRLSDAIRDQDTIRAIIRASASNQDGRTLGITQPNGQAQAELIRETYRRAGLSMAHTLFFEAHGTGTSIGDPTEVEAIADCFRHHRNSASPLYVGAVKTNVGHLEGASGIAALIKAILVAESGVIPPNTNFERINRRLEAYDYCIVFPAQCLAWPEGAIRRISINSFGYGGSNCHIVIDDAYSYLRRHKLQGNHRTALHIDQDSLRESFTMTLHQKYKGALMVNRMVASPNHPKLLIWSASTANATKMMLSRWQAHLRNTSPLREPSWLSNIAYTLDSRRSSLAWKSYAVVRYPSDLLNLSELASTPQLNGNRGPRLGFVFTGQGAQWYAMGRELLIYSAFKNVVEEAEKVCKNLGSCWSVKDELLKDAKYSRVDSPDISQVLTATIQIGLVDLLESFNVSPVAVVGHSMGEIAAAYCAKLLTRASAFKLVYYRGLLVSTIPKRDTMKGAMLAAALSPQQIQIYFDRLRSQINNFNLVIGCINSPINVTVSGDEEQIEKLKDMLQTDNIFTRKLKTAVAYHSSQILQIKKDCMKYFSSLHSPETSSSIKMISSVTGSGILSGQTACDPSYWVTNMESPVLFQQAIQRMCRDSESCLRNKIDGSHRDAIVVDLLVEVGPHAALRLPIQETVDTLSRKEEVCYLSALYRGQPAMETIMKLMGSLYCSGVPVDIRQVNDPRHTGDDCISLVDSPSYPFDHSVKYWSESPLSRNYRLRTEGHVELLGSPSRDWNPLAPEWRCCVDTTEMPWLLDHKLNGRAIYPASAMIIMAVESIYQVARERQSNITGFTLRKVRFYSAIAVGRDVPGVETRLRLQPLSGLAEDRWAFSIYSVTEEKWSKNCTGYIQVHWVDETASSTQLDASHYRRLWRRAAMRCRHTIQSQDLYRTFNRNGFEYGPSLQGILTISHNSEKQAIADISLDQPRCLSPINEKYVIHPATLDSFMQLALVALSVDGGGGSMPTQVISAIDKLWISSRGLRMSSDVFSALATVEKDSPRNKSYSLFAMNKEKQEMRLFLDGLHTTLVSSSTVSKRTVQGANQFWYTVHRSVDIDTLSLDKVQKRLEYVCGPDAVGPVNFSHALQIFLYKKIVEIRRYLTTADMAPPKAYLLKYIDWIDWQLSKPAGSPVSWQNMSEETLRSHIIEQGLLGSFFLEVSDNVLGVLQGNIDIVELLFAGGLLEKFYENHSRDSVYYKKLGVYLKDLSFKHPNMDIMEVGAGTGSFTTQILDGLPIGDSMGSYYNYWYTDVSPGFFGKARDRFANNAHKMTFKVLDIDKDPLMQGFQPEEFDIISASNVLHVTTDIGQTLRRLRKLLKAGGKLLLHEIVRPESVAAGFVFGLLPGWWPTGGSDNRSLSPVLSEETWDTLLRKNGFSGADLALRDYADEDSHLMSIICSTAVEPHEFVAEDDPQHSINVLVEPHSALQRDIAARIVASLCRQGVSGTQTISLLDVAHMSHSQLGTIIMLCDLEDAILARMDYIAFDRLKSLFQSARDILWISGGGGHTAHPNFGMMDGFAKVLRIEKPKSRMITLALEEARNSPTAATRAIVTVLNRLLRDSKNIPEDYIMMNGSLHISRILENSSFKKMMLEKLSNEKTSTKSLLHSQPFIINLDSSGDQVLLKAIERDETNDLNSDLDNDEVEIEVHAVGLSDFDFSMIRGDLPGNCFGRQCAGVIVRSGSSYNSPFYPGDRVCAYSVTTPPGSTVRTKVALVARIPETMSWKEASTKPQALVSAQYLTEKISRVSNNDSVILVQSDCSLISTALINQIHKRWPNLFVMVTTTSEEKIMKDIFPTVSISIKSNLLANFRLMFPSGADIVIDLTTSNISELAESVSAFGHVITVKTDGARTQLEPLAISELLSNITVHVVDIATVLHSNFRQLQMPSQTLEEEYTGIYESGSESQSIRLFEAQKNSSILRGQTTGCRVVVEFESGDPVVVTRKLSPEYSFEPSSSYLISGGFGDLGRCIASWMVKRGARHLIILSRSGPSTDKAKELIEDLKRSGARIYSLTCDIIDRRSLLDALSRCSREMPQIKGCIQTSAVLKDVMYENMGFEDWMTAVSPKVQGSWNLHELLPRQMDFFILTSSITGIMGQATQINYAAGNTYQDSLARYRLSLGEKAVSLDLGLLATGGLLSSNKKLKDRLISTNLYSPHTEAEVIALLDYFCNPSLDISQIPAQVVTGIARPYSHFAHNAKADIPAAFYHPFWRHIFNPSTAASSLQTSIAPCIDGAATTSHSCDNVSTYLGHVQSFAEASKVVTEALVDKFCRLLLIQKSKLDVHKPLHAAGADSLVAVDLRNWIMKEFSVDMPIFDILGDRPLLCLGERIAQEYMPEQPPLH